jgi:hypothetical protein
VGDAGHMINVNLEGLAKPVTKLIECVSRGAGILYEPTRIRREARAVADAELISKRAGLDSVQLDARIADRIAFNETRRQRNIDAIVGEAARQLPQSVSDAPVDEDWTARFFADCADVGDSEAQRIWSKVLAGEVERPGRFSLRTLSILRELRRIDALLFRECCALAWEDVGTYFVPKLYGTISNSNDCMIKHGLTYSALLMLSDSGLLIWDTTAGIGRDPGSTATWKYGAHQYIVQWPKTSFEHATRDVPVLVFSSAGAELIEITDRP